MSEKADKALESAMLNNETGTIAWDELARHFARGVVIRVDRRLDLVLVAQAVLNDDTKNVSAWQSSGQISRASDDDARSWHAQSSEFWAIVIAPWVIVQEKEKSTEAEPSVDLSQLH